MKLWRRDFSEVILTQTTAKGSPEKNIVRALRMTQRASKSFVSMPGAETWRHF